MNLILQHDWFQEESELILILLVVNRTGWMQSLCALQYSVIFRDNKKKKTLFASLDQSIIM